MTLNEILSILRGLRITHTQAWADAESHYVRLYFDKSLDVEFKEVKPFDIEKVYNLIDSSVGFDPDDEEIKGKVKKVLQTFVEGHSFYKKEIISKFVLTFAGNNRGWNKAIVVSIDLPEEEILSENAIFVTNGEDSKDMEIFGNLFFTGQSIVDMQALDDNAGFSTNDKPIRFTLSNGLLLEANSFGLDIPEPKGFIRYTPEKGLKKT